MTLIEIIILIGATIILIMVALPWASYICAYMQMVGKINAIKNNPNHNITNKNGEKEKEQV